MNGNLTGLLPLRSWQAQPRSDAKRLYKNRQPRQQLLTGSPFRVGGELLSHGLPQYHRRGGA